MTVAHDELVAEQRDNAIGLTSGGITTKELARKGHPYARRLVGRRKKGGKFSGAPNLPINRQEGVLQRSIRLPRRYKGPKGQIYDLFFDPAAARARLYVVSPGGTSRMRSRGFWREMTKRYRKAALLNKRKFMADMASIHGQT
jgi:hypothetical protein